MSLTDASNRSETGASVERFLYAEARLMDQGRYREWLDLFTDDALYWVPSNREDADPGQHVSILHLDRKQLETFIDRLEGGKAFAQDPPSRVVRLVSNVMIEEDDEAEIRASAVFLAVERRSGRERLHTGRNEYCLRRGGDGFAIASKKVVLIDIDAPQENVSFLL